MSKGSGIATYARNLGEGLSALGYETHLLYGPSRDASTNPLLNEIRLYEPPGAAPKRSKAWYFMRRQVSRLEREAVPVERSGEIDTRQFGDRDFAADRLWACPDLFHKANRDFGAQGRFTDIRFAGADAKAIDAAHWTCVLPLHTPDIPNLYTIHDLVPLRLPFATLDDKHRFFDLCRGICARADHVVTVSEQSKRDIVRVFGIDEARISNTYQAVRIPEALAAVPDHEAASEIESAFGLPWRGYFLFFGAVEPKKNLARLIEAYLTSGAKVPLIIVGGRAWLDTDEMRLMYDDLLQRHMLQDGFTVRSDRIRRYDYLPRPILIDLIRGARATLFPSLSEGFGLPILESMQLGTPVLTSAEGAAAEVAGDAAMLVDPYDTRAIKRAIQALDADEALCHDLSRRGRLQAAKFSPAEYERRLGDLYRTLL